VRSEGRPPPVTRPYKTGDRVVALRWPRDGAGVIVKPAPVHPLVRWDGSDEDKRVRAADVRPETAEDIARRGRAQTMQAWQDRRPKTASARVAYAPYQGSDSTGVEIHEVLRTPESMRGAAAELLQLADWFAERPANDS